MSTEIDDTSVDSAAPDAVETTPATQETTPPAQTTPSRADRIDSLRGKARDHYKLTGNLDAAEKLSAPEQPNSDAKADSSTAQPGADDAQTEGASGTPTTTQPKQTRQDRDWKTLREKTSTQERELIALKAKLEIYERNHSEGAASRQSAPAAATPAENVDDRPEFPDIGKYKTESEFNAAVRQWQKLDSEWVQRQLDTRLTGRDQQQQTQQSEAKWNTQLEESRKAYKDYDQVVFSDSAPIAFATLAAIQSMPDGALRAYPLAKNLELATKLAELTHIPGEHQFQGPNAFNDFMKWVKADPERAMIYGEKLALAKIELAKLETPASKAAIRQKPLKEVIAASAAPSASVDVDANAAPVTDPIGRAIQKMKDTGDNRDYNRLMNERDLQNRKLR